MSKFVIFKDKSGEWRFNLVASNNKVIAVSEGYKSKQSAKRGIKSVITSANEAFFEEILEEDMYY